jgi:hypothetical protein
MSFEKLTDTHWKEEVQKSIRLLSEMLPDYDLVIHPLDAEAIVNYKNSGLIKEHEEVIAISKDDESEFEEQLTARLDAELRIQNNMQVRLQQIPDGNIAFIIFTPLIH